MSFEIDFNDIRGIDSSIKNSFPKFAEVKKMKKVNLKQTRNRQVNLVDEIVKIVSQPQVLLNLETHKVIFYFLFVHLSILSILSNVYKQLNNDLQIFH